MKKSAKYVSAAAALSVVFLLSQAQAASASERTVYMYDNYYWPSSITVTSGTRVTWINAGMMPHTVTDDSGRFESGSIAPGGSYSRTFTTAGTYSYHCNFHPNMRGSITVTSSNPNPSPHQPNPNPQYYWCNGYYSFYPCYDYYSYYTYPAYYSYTYPYYSYGGYGEYYPYDPYYGWYDDWYGYGGYGYYDYWW